MFSRKSSKCGPPPSFTNPNYTIIEEEEHFSVDNNITDTTPILHTVQNSSNISSLCEPTNVLENNDMNQQQKWATLRDKPNVINNDTNQIDNSIDSEIQRANKYSESIRVENIRLRAQIRDLRETINDLHIQLENVDKERTNILEQQRDKEKTRADRLQSVIDNMEGGVTSIQYQMEIDRLSELYSKTDAELNNFKEHIINLESIIKKQNDKINMLSS